MTYIFLHFFTLTTSHNLAFTSPNEATGVCNLLLSLANEVVIEPRQFSFLTNFLKWSRTEYTRLKKEDKIIPDINAN